MYKYCFIEGADAPIKSDILPGQTSLRSFNYPPIKTYEKHAKTAYLSLRSINKNSDSIQTENPGTGRIIAFPFPDFLKSLVKTVHATRYGVGTVPPL